jgi:RimJ/RimL family protein N-acetyltransferase
MKRTTIDLAEQWAIPVTGSVRLVPIGAWILNHDQFIADMAYWRFTSRDSFFARFPLSPESFKTYLVDHSLSSQCNLTFAIMRNSAELVGHIGLSEVKFNQASIDAVMISPEARSGGLARLSLESLIDWSELTLSVTHFELEVLSSNAGAIKLYSRCGFEVSEVYPLKEVSDGDMLLLKECGIENSNVEELKFVMSLNRSPVT